MTKYMTLIGFRKRRKRYCSGNPRFDLNAALIFVVDIGKYETNKTLNFSSAGELRKMIDDGEAFKVVSAGRGARR
jgi:hypothetical protein